MKPEEFKQKGLKSGDKVEVIYVDRKTYNITGVIHGIWGDNGAGNWWVQIKEPDGRIWDLHGPDIASIKKLKVTKKKEKKEDLGSNTDIASKTFQKEANHILNQYNAALEQMQKRTFVKDEKGFREEKSIKSLYTLEVGDEVTDGKNIYMVRLIGKVDGDLMYAMSDSDCRIRLYEVHKLDANGFSIYTPKPTELPSIIDEMIEFLGACIKRVDRSDDQYTIASKKLHNEKIIKFITYLKDLKNV